MRELHPGVSEELGAAFPRDAWKVGRVLGKGKYPYHGIV